MTDQTQARDVIAALINTAWLADPISAGVALLWADTIDDKPPANDSNGNAVPFVRVAIRHSLGRQDTLAARGRRRYLYGGVVQVQIFTPLGDGKALADQLAQVVKFALTSALTTSQVWFFDITPNDLGRDGPWYFDSIDAVFRYQEVA